MPNVMYHFVGGNERLMGVSVELFKAQLDYLQKEHTNEEIILTFDHGTIDHLEVVAPEIEKRGLTGYFFVLTMVPEDHRVPTVDKQRFLEAEHRHELAEMLCDELYIDYHPQDAKDYLNDYPFYSLEERYLRMLRNEQIPSRVYESIIGSIFNNAFRGEIDFCQQHYLAWHHIYQLHKRGHIIGSHTHNHFGDKDDFAKSLDLIENVIGERPEYVSYPNGVKRVSDEDLKAMGVQIGYCTQPNGDLPYKTPVIDCSWLKIPDPI